MKKITLIFIALVMPFLVLKAQKPDGFYGMWSIEIENGSVGWLHVFENEGFLDAELLWRWGSVLPVQSVFVVDDNNLIVMRTSELKRKGTDGKERQMVAPHLFEISRSGDRISGKSFEPSRDGMQTTGLKFYGWKVPDVPAAPDLSKIKYGNPVKLFNGKDLSGWKLINPGQTNGFKVEKGIMVNDQIGRASCRERVYI